MLSFEVEDRLGRIARTIIGDANVKFGFSGSDYYCEQRGDTYHINFASPPAEVDEEYVKTLEGFLDHEVAHALFTDFKVIKHLRKTLHKKNLKEDKDFNAVRDILNTLEDHRIESLMGKKYPGSRDNIDYMNAVVTESLRRQDPEGLSEYAQKNLALWFALYGEKNPPEYLKDFMKKYEEDIPKALDWAKDTESTQDALDCALKIYEYFKYENPEDDDAPPPPKDEEDPESNDGDGDSDPDSEDEAPNDSDEENNNSQEDDPDPEGEDAEGSGNSDNESDESEDDDPESEGDGGGENDPEKDGDNGSEENDSGEDDPERDGDNESKGENDPNKEGDNESDSNQKEEDNPLEGKNPKGLSLGQLGGELPENWKYGVVGQGIPSDGKLEEKDDLFRAGYEGPEYPTPVTRSKDIYHKNNKLVEVRQRAVNPKINFLAKKISSLFKAEKITHYDRGLKRGKIDGGSLYKIKHSSDIFKKLRGVSRELDLVFCLGIDNSSSMDPEYTREILEDVMLFMHYVGVPFYAFTYHSFIPSHMSNEQYLNTDAAYDLGFSRTIPLYINIIKDFEDSYQERIKKVDIPQGVFTPTPEAFEHALKMLRTRKEQHKIFVNITDGEPMECVAARSQEYYHKMLKNLMGLMTREKMEYFNIGYNMGTHFYDIDPNATLVTSENCIEILVNLLTKRIGRALAR